MISYQQETLFDVIHEVDGLLKMHHEEVSLDQDKIKLEPMWEHYAQLERIGGYLLFTARYDGALIGYAAFFVNRHFHHANTTVAVSDVLFLHPGYRKGRAGIDLIKFSEQKLKEIGINKLCLHVTFKNDFRRILHRMGYADEEVIVSKILGE